jgi:hypothetical protein
MAHQAKLLTPPANFAVVQLPDRQYPGVIFQGDTLRSLVASIIEMQQLPAEQNLDDLKDEIQSLLQNLSAVQRSYERVCSEQGIELPYTRQESDLR